MLKKLRAFIFGDIEAVEARMRDLERQYRAGLVDDGTGIERLAERVAAKVTAEIARMFDTKGASTGAASAPRRPK